MKTQNTRPLPLNVWLLVVLLLSLQTGCYGLRDRAWYEANWPERIIDAHVHTAFSGRPALYSSIPYTAEQLRQEMAANRVVGFVAHTANLQQALPSMPPFLTAYCAGITATYDRHALETALASGAYHCIKVYLGYVHHYAYDAFYDPVYELAAKYDLPVVFHTGDTASDKAKLKYAHPLTVDEVAVAHPHLTLVIAHVGNPWWETAAQVAYKNPNVYLDGSALLVGDLAGAPSATIDTYLVEPLRWSLGYMDAPEKLLFGTDWPLVHLGPYIRAFKRAIPRQHWQAVFYDNAVRVFKLHPPPPPTVASANDPGNQPGTVVAKRPDLTPIDIP